MIVKLCHGPLDGAIFPIEPPQEAIRMMPPPVVSDDEERTPISQPAWAHYVCREMELDGNTGVTIGWFYFDHSEPIAAPA